MVWYHTISVARAAYAAGDLDKAKLYTEQALTGPPTRAGTWKERSSGWQFPAQDGARLKSTPSVPT
jgi:hypothetical protein